MKKTLFIISLGLIASITHGQNQNISQGLVFDGEPYISVNPSNSQHLVVAWMGYAPLNQIVIKTKVSFDAGQSWSAKVNIPHAHTLYASADPSLEFDGAGNVYLSYVDFSEMLDSGEVFIRKSTDGGISWGNPVEVIGMHTDLNKRAIDRPWIIIDRSGGTNDGNIYVTTMNVSTFATTLPPYHPYLIRSTDGGASFEPYKYIDATGWLAGPLIPNPMPSPAISSNGTIHAVYPSWDFTQNSYPQILLASSSDGGNSFSYNTVYSAPTFFTDSLAKKAGLLRVNPADDNHLIFLSIGNDNGDGDVVIRESFDTGNNWSLPTRINDDPIGNNKMQDLVWADFDHDGDLVVSWRDRRNAADSSYSTSSEIWASFRSKDSIEFSPNFRISDTIISYDSVLAAKGNDFMCIKLVNDTLNAVWGDVRNGKLNIWFNRMSLNGTILSTHQLNSESLPSINIYPNPTSSKFLIEGIVMEQINIYDQQGKGLLTEQYSEKSNSVTISLDNFSKGIYFLHIKTMDGFVIKKVIKK